MKESQCTKVLEHLKKHGSITASEASRLYRIMRLAARIKDLKAKGVAIISETVTAKNEDGRTAHFSVYRLAKEAD